jgi:hypothetical protein
MKVELTNQEVELVLNILAQQPYANVAQLIAKITEQAKVQLNGIEE